MSIQNDIQSFDACRAFALLLEQCEATLDTLASTYLLDFCAPHIQEIETALIHAGETLELQIKYKQLTTDPALQRPTHLEGTVDVRLQNTPPVQRNFQLSLLHGHSGAKRTSIERLCALRHAIQTDLSELQNGTFSAEPQERLALYDQTLCAARGHIPAQT